LGQAVPHAAQGTVGSFEMLGKGAPDNWPMAQLIQTNEFLNYVFMLTVDSEGQKYELVKDLGITSHKIGETFSN
jgi:hypothetical protein